MTMVPLDYARSFMIGRSPLNEVRLWVESRTRIIDERDGVTEDYIQCASCKSEHTFAEKDLFQEDNWDFLPIFGPEYTLIYRRKAWLNPNYRSCLKTVDLWDGPAERFVESSALQELTTPREILQATYDNRPIVAQTEIWNSDTGLRAIIEYPVKSLNTIRKGDIYQIDTGPLAFPDLAQRSEKLVDLISLAFVAFNALHFADFVIEVPTAIETAPGTDGTQVYHYSRIISLDAENRLYAAT